jgi:hypothetical protein
VRLRRWKQADAAHEQAEWHKTTLRIIAQRGGREKQLAAAAEALRCQQEWSNSHDHGECILEHVEHLKHQRDAAEALVRAVAEWDYSFPNVTVGNDDAAKQLDVIIDRCRAHVDGKPPVESEAEKLVRAVAECRPWYTLNGYFSCACCGETGAAWLEIKHHDTCIWHRCLQHAEKLNQKENA